MSNISNMYKTGVLVNDSIFQPTHDRRRSVWFGLILKIWDVQTPRVNIVITIGRV